MKRRSFLKKSGEVTLGSFIVNSLAHASKKPIYEPTQKQIDFIEKSKTYDYLWGHRDLFFKNAENIRNGKLAGSPLEDMLKIMNEEGILPQPADIRQWSLEYNMNEDEIVNAYGLHGLQIIDGKPERYPNQKGLVVLRDTGLLDHINENWKLWFDEERKEKLRIERQQFGITFMEPGDSRFIGYQLAIEYADKTTTFRKYITEQEKKTGVIPLRRAISIIRLGIVYADSRLFEEIPQEYKLVKHPIYTKLLEKAELDNKELSLITA